ncbi:MAG TPA: hypothetical protein VEG08_06485 [Terriglobales bacterium]|nr:hypothetical protein [Terriglobales bacterium]
MTVRRMKTYTGEMGFVYQYYFVGKRAALPGDLDAPATEFIFDVTADRKTMVSSSILVKPEALRAWAQAHGRELTEAEQYAVAKMRLFRAFDQAADFQQEGRRLRVDAADIEGLLEGLGL